MQKTPLVYIFFLLISLFSFSCGKEYSSFQTIESNYLHHLVTPSSPEQKEIEFPKKDQLVLDIKDIKVLENLSEKLSLSHFMGLNDKQRKEDPLFKSYKKLSNKKVFEKSLPYQSFVNEFSSSLTRIREKLEKEDISTTKKVVNFVSRIFDKNWLSSPFATYQLIGIVNRVDRQDFSDNENCGEMRLIYRLYYYMDSSQGQTQVSPMPFVFNLVLEYPKDDFTSCREIATNWVSPNNFSNMEDYRNWLLTKPLNLSNLRLKQLEVNSQVIRHPSEIAGGFGGQASYLMQVYSIKENSQKTIDKLTLENLENTIDVVKIKKNPKLKKDLISFIKANIVNIDQGVYNIPDKFLTKEAISVSTFGSARLTNSLFSQVLEESDLTNIDYQKLRFANTPSAIIERMNNSTCLGCHQGSSTAGFHFLGKNDYPVNILNQVEIGISPHYKEELSRREKYIKDFITKGIPNTFRPHSLSPAIVIKEQKESYQNAKVTMPCIPDDMKKHFKNPWSCQTNQEDKGEKGLECVVLASNKNLAINFGQCLRQDNDKMFAGHPCLKGEIQDDSSQPFNDSYKLKQIRCFSDNGDDKGYTCRSPRIGVPGGLCYRKAKYEEYFFPEDTSQEFVALAGGKQFDNCSASDNPHLCLQAAMARGLRETCHEDKLCREDYICQKFPEFSNTSDEIKGRVKGKGFCVPTYFLFQLRIDGHPDPIEGLN